MTSPSPRPPRTPERVCHFCGLVIEDNEKVIEAKTRNGWAHVTCWYDGGPFERKMRGLLRRREDSTHGLPPAPGSLPKLPQSAFNLEKKKGKKGTRGQ
jgi:hypothetical protein